MQGLLNKICGSCGDKVSYAFVDRINVSCQKCGSRESIFITKERVINLKCPFCLSVLSLPNSKKVTIDHPCPAKKNQQVSIFDVINEAGSHFRTGENVVLVRRNRGLGDVLMTTAILPYLKRRHKGKELWYSCDADVVGGLKNNPFIDRILVNREDKHVEDFVKIYDLRQKVEDYGEKEEINKQNRNKRFFDLCDIPLPVIEKIRPQYYIQDDETSWAENLLSSKKKRIGLGLTACAPFRNWEQEKYMDMIRKLGKRNEYVLFGDKPVKMFGSGIINTCGQLTVRELAALLTRCDVVVCGDTGIYHLCEALKVPCIVLFGSIPPEARTKYYKYVTPIYKPPGCSPCWDKQGEDTIGIAKCKKDGPQCMRNITVEDVGVQIGEIL